LPLAGNIEVAYANNNANGTGNLRDSDSWKSLYDYEDDAATTYPPIYVPTDKLGGGLIGKPYPCYNFASHLYYTETI